MTAPDLPELLQTVLQKHNVTNITVNTVTKPGPGDGYGSDMVFVNATGTNQAGLTQNYDLVVKSSKVQAPPVKMVFKTESSIYTKIIPTLNQFLTDKKITNLISCVPQCYGFHSGENIDAIILENLKVKEYTVWNKQLPWIKENIETVLREYGKLHAVSVAMAKENPEKFRELTSHLGAGFGKLLETFGLIPVVEALIEEVYNLLIDVLDKEILQKWLAMKQQVKYIYTDLVQNIDSLKVITHGDCWSNNFMLKIADKKKLVASEIALLDWQISSLTSPILDVSYFLFACLSKTDLNRFRIHDILEYYYKSFSDYLKSLGTNPDLLYSKEQFLKDWRKYAKYGIITCFMGLKASHSELTAETQKFDVMSDDEKAIFKKRVVGIVQYAVEQELI